jgi:cytochrome c peroxidase
MKIKSKIFFVLFLISICSFYACKKDNSLEINPTPYNLVVPNGLPNVISPADNKLTEEGVALGRKLFYDPILSLNNMQSCASCHNQANAFVDTSQFSKGVNGNLGHRNSMPLFNIAYANSFFWDGRKKTLEEQALAPIQDKNEMNETLPHVIAKLKAEPTYVEMFKKSFGSNAITELNVAKAIAQFERILLSGNSKYDKAKRGEETLTAEEQMGEDLYTDQQKGDCTHCHSIGSTFTDFDFKNNGLDAIAVDSGRYLVTKNIFDLGKMKTPSVRNLKYTAPYMHDGRFKTLDEVMFHYNIGFKHPANLDVNMAEHFPNRMTVQEVKAIIAFLNTLNDEEFVVNPAFAKP